MIMQAVLGVPWEELWSDEGQEEVTEVKKRDPPPSVVIPDDLFRTSCRMIRIEVGRGENTTIFVVHEPLLRASSTYLTTKLDLDGKDGDGFDVLQLPADSPKIFGLVNRYLYTGAIPSHDWQYLVPFPLHPLCDIWLLAYDLGIAHLVNYMTWCLIQRLDEKRTYEVATTLPGNLEIIYEHAPVGSTLRKLLVDMCVWEFEDYEPSTMAPNKMSWDYCEALKQKNKATVSPLLDVSNYYTTEEEMEPKHLTVGTEAVSTDSRTTAGSIVLQTQEARGSSPADGAADTINADASPKAPRVHPALRPAPPTLAQKSRAPASIFTDLEDPQTKAMREEKLSDLQEKGSDEDSQLSNKRLLLLSMPIHQATPFLDLTSSHYPPSLFSPHLHLRLPLFQNTQVQPPLHTNQSSILKTQASLSTTKSAPKTPKKTFSLGELRFADIQPKEKEIITLSDDESEIEVDLKSEVKTEGTWRWREYIDADTSTAAAASSKKGDKAPSKDTLKPSNGVLVAPLTPLPSLQKAPRSSNPATTPTRVKATTKKGKEKEEEPTAMELRELGRAYRMRPS